MLDRLSSWYRDRSSEWNHRLDDTEVLLALSSTTARSIRSILEQVDRRRARDGQALLPTNPWFIHPDLECEVALSYLIDAGNVTAVPFDPAEIRVDTHNPGIELSKEDLAEIQAYQEGMLEPGESPPSTAYRMLTPKRRDREVGERWGAENMAWQYVPVPVRR